MVRICDMRAMVRLVIFSCAMLLAPAAWAAETPGGAKEQAQRQQDQPLNNAPVWTDVRRGENQYQTTQVRGIETNVLIQSEGQLWREIRNGPITVYGGWALIVVLLLILGFGVLVTSVSVNMILQTIVEEFETSQEEMKASNEELQSANEELRSTMEELETSKEELQSMNEELQTVNQENRHKVEELAQLSGDLQNLLAATDIATLFLDRELRILRFTPKVGELFNVRLTDRGRPLSDLTHRLVDSELLMSARRVLERLVPVEHEVRDHVGRWYLTRVLPYRSAEDRIEGVVVTFVDITSRKPCRIAQEEIKAGKVKWVIPDPKSAVEQANELLERAMTTGQTDA